MQDKFKNFVKNKNVLKNILAAFSIITAMTFIYWNLVYGGGYLFASNSQYIKACMAVMMINILFGLILSTIFIFFNNSKKVVFNIIGMAILYLVLYVLFYEIELMLTFDRTSYFSSTKYWRNIYITLSSFFIFFCFNRKKCFILMRQILLVLSPIMIFFYFSLTKDIIKTYTIKQSPINANTANNPRVLLLIFDELDQYLAFSNRPKYLKLDGLDEFKNISFYSENAYSPTNWTLSSLPSYIYGKYITAAFVYGDSKLSFVLPNKKRLLIDKKSDNIFTEISKLKLNSALIGWYHPYSRLVKGPHHCHVYGGSLDFINMLKKHFVRIINYYNSSVNNFFPKVSFALRKKVPEDTTKYQKILKKTLNYSCNSDFNFIFVHFSIPHGPSLYNLKKQKLEGGTASYLGNLKLVDLTLAKIKKEMIKNKLWDSTTVIITSDHPFRINHGDNYRYFNDKEALELKKIQPEPLIPCMIKLANSTTSFKFERKFNTLVLHDLILEIFQNKVQNMDELVGYVEKHSDDYFINSST